MNILKELVQIINRVKLRSIRKLGFPFTDNNQLDQMYSLLEEGNTEAEIARELTGKTLKSSAYKRLKIDLTNRLIVSLFLVDLSLPSYNSRQKAYYEIVKNQAATKILLGKNATQAGIDLAEKCLRKALHFEFNDIAVDLARTLSLLYATVIGNTKKYEQYNRIYQQLSVVVPLEQKAEEAYADLIINDVRSKQDSQLISQKANRLWLELEPFTNQYNAYSLHLYAGLLKMISYTSIGNFKQTAVLCDEWIAFFKQKEYTASVPLQIAYYQKLHCHFQLKTFDEHSPFIAEGLALLEEGSYNWFKFLETYMLLLFHTQKYEEALSVYQKVIYHKRFNNLPKDVKEYWRILGAYVHYWIEIGEISVDKSDPSFSKFRIGRFLNQTPLFSKDKRGLNVSILIVQILFLIARGRYGETIDKINAVEQYSRRHLFRDDTLRSFYFIKALLLIPKSAFHKQGVKRKADKYLKRLDEYPLEEVRSASFITEIIPFEVLWDRVIKHLPNKFYR